MVKAETGKGEVAEETLAEYFRAAGFFAVRGIPFRHEGANLTDLDVWLYERGAGVSRRRCIVDSKNKKTPKVVERIFWTSGLRDALDLDVAFVASTSPREETQKIARRVNITLIDVTALNRGGGSEAIQSSGRYSKEELDALLATMDKEHESKLWRGNRDDVAASVIMGFGGGTANVGLRAAKFFAEHALASAPNSTTRVIAQRMLFFSIALVGVGLDFIAAQSEFQPLTKRKADLEDTLRYGANPDESKRRLSLASELVRGYLPNGAAIASQLRSRIDDATKAMPVDIIADVVIKMAGKGHLFEAARALERAAYEKLLSGFSDLGTDARSFAGAVFDFLGLDRVKMANILTGAPNSSSVPAATPDSTGAKTLFESDTKS
jgi:hypothetical protein